MSGETLILVWAIAVLTLSTVGMGRTRTQGFFIGLAGIAWAAVTVIAFMGFVL